MRIWPMVQSANRNAVALHSPGSARHRRAPPWLRAREKSCTLKECHIRRRMSPAPGRPSARRPPTHRLWYPFGVRPILIRLLDRRQTPVASTWSKKPGLVLSGSAFAHEVPDRQTTADDRMEGNPYPHAGPTLRRLGFWKTECGQLKIHFILAGSFPALVPRFHHMMSRFALLNSDPMILAVRWQRDLV